jgi:enoyl-CoA hydratase/carnithine racemase
MMPVQYEVHERIATVTLNRPEAMNSLDPESLVKLNDAFQRANTDQDVRVVILTGAGETAFCTGSEMALSICRHGNRQAHDRRGERLRARRGNGACARV